jgi:hypothetical protein
MATFLGLILYYRSIFLVFNKFARSQICLPCSQSSGASRSTLYGGPAAQSKNITSSPGLVNDGLMIFNQMVEKNRIK